jgi:drug/metabolite transporter (DMT)-like permease
MSARRRGQLAILLAAVMWSTAGIGQRELSVTAATQVAGRALFAALTLAVVTAALERERTVGVFRTMGRWGLAFAVLMAISSGTFMLALSYTTVANVLFMQAAAPLLAALLGWALLDDPIPGRTAVAIAVSALGVAVMVAGSFESGWVATVLPFVMTAAFAGVVVIARHRSEVSMLPATCLSQVMVVVVVAPFASFSAATGHDWAVLAALGIGQMGLALALLTIGARLIAPAEVALLSLVEVVLGPLLVWLAYDERPGATTLVGGAIVLVAVVIQATSSETPRGVQAFG